MKEASLTPGPSPEVTPPTREVLLRVQQRDSAALGELFEYAFDRVFGLAVRMLGNRAAAEDLVQEVFLRVHRAADRLDPDRDPMSWLLTITANLCRDHFRSFEAKVAQRSRPAEGDEDHPVPLKNGGPTPEAQALTTEKETLVQDALEKLPLNLREIVLLRDYEGLPHETIAGMLGATSAAVRKRYSRALAQLGEILEEKMR